MRATRPPALASFPTRHTSYPASAASSAALIPAIPLPMTSMSAFITLLWSTPVASSNISHGRVGKPRTEQGHRPGAYPSRGCHFAVPPPHLGSEQAGRRLTLAGLYYYETTSTYGFWLNSQSLLPGW